MTERKQRSKIPATVLELYTVWSPKIRKTVKSREKIFDYEVDDVVQIIFLAALEKDWLKKYDGSTAFSTFLYTYVLQEIQNYINKRDSANTIKQTGSQRYTRFSSMSSVDDDSVLNLMDKLSFAGLKNRDEYQFRTDCSIFYERARKAVVYTFTGFVSYLDILDKLLAVKQVTRVNRKGDDYTHHEGFSNKDIAHELGVDIQVVNGVEKSLHIFGTDNVSTALDYLDSNFLRLEEDEAESL